jgi:hypothetical protein
VRYPELRAAIRLPARHTRLASPPEPDPRRARVLFSRGRGRVRRFFFFPARSLARVRAWGCLPMPMLPDAVHHADAEERVPVTPAVSRGGQGSLVRFGSWHAWAAKTRCTG